MRGIIRDNLLDKELLTRKCRTEKAAKTEAEAIISRLCKKYKIDVESDRFNLIGFEF